MSSSQTVSVKEMLKDHWRNRVEQMCGYLIGSKSRRAGITFNEASKLMLDWLNKEIPDLKAENFPSMDTDQCQKIINFLHKEGFK